MNLLINRENLHESGIRDEGMGKKAITSLWLIQNNNFALINLKTNCLIKVGCRYPGLAREKPVFQAIPGWPVGLGKNPIKPVLARFSDKSSFEHSISRRLIQYPSLDYYFLFKHFTIYTFIYLIKFISFSEVKVKFLKDIMLEFDSLNNLHENPVRLQKTRLQIFFRSTA